MEPPTSPSPTKLKIRAYACTLSARKVKQGLLRLVETSPAFNESWLNGEYDVGTRIGGFNQYGDIIVRHSTPRRGKNELTIEHRAGDEALAAEIESNFAKSLTPKAPDGCRPETSGGDGVFLRDDPGNPLETPAFHRGRRHRGGA